MIKPGCNNKAEEENCVRPFKGGNRKNYDYKIIATRELEK